MATAEIRQHVSTAGSLTPSCGCAAQRLSSARHCFRDLLMTLYRFCRYSFSLAFCAENAALALPSAATVGISPILEQSLRKKYLPMSKKPLPKKGVTVYAG